MLAVFLALQTMNRYFERIWQALSDSRDAARGDTFPASAPQTLPVIWLLGKTGAGKSSLVRCLTGVDAAELGNGFEACTRTAVVFAFPPEMPLMQFLDTRGLGEAGYDPREDLQECRDRSHVVLAVARVDDPVQGEVAAALERIHALAPATRILVIHNGGDLVPDAQQYFRARSQTQQLFEQAVGKPLASVDTTLRPEALSLEAPGIGELVDRLDGIIPEIALLLMQEELRSVEQQVYAGVRGRTIWYASAAGTADVAPVIGAVAVPAIQAAMLRALGASYGVEWTRERFGNFAVALGIGIAGRFGGSYLARQLAKLVPVYGQTLGAATAGAMSFATTFALGRAAAYYLHGIQQGKTVRRAEVRALYRDALRRARQGPDNRSVAW